MRPSALLMLVLCAGAGRAQSSPQTEVHVRVLDSADAPLSNVNVALVEGLSNVVTSATTNGRGEVTLTVPAARAFQLVARRIGFQRASRFFSTTPEAMALTIHLARTVAQLAPVNVSASVFSRRQAYHVAADEIAASERPVYDGFDVISKIRPLIMDPPPRSHFNPCLTENIWVNGQRIPYAKVDERLKLDKRHKQAALAAMYPPSARFGVTAQPPIGMSSLPLTVLSVLAMIRAEHIDEVNYSDCQDNSVEGVHTSNSIFITLKTGVGFDPVRGSYVVEQTVALAANHPRLIGVFDEDTGLPLPGVQLTDSASHFSVVTTETGTAMLGFMADGEHVVWLRKKGYAEVATRLKISERDSLPVTLTLAPHK